MKHHAWTAGLLSAGLISLPSVLHSEEAPSSVLTAVASTTLSGYVDTSAQWNLGNGNAHTPPYAFSQGKADGFNLNVVKLTLEKPIAPEDHWAAGYKVDLIAGPDASLLNTVSPLSSGVSDFGVKQAYVSLHAPIGNGIDFKLGVWDTIIGYEVFDSPLNPHATHSYGYTIESTTHTGLLASYQLVEGLSATVGIADSMGPSINQRSFYANAESFKTYMGSLTYTVSTNAGFLSGSTLTGCIMNGYNSAFGANETSWYAGATFNTPVTGLKAGASYDYLGISEQRLGGARFANATAIYLSYQLTEKLALLARQEYASSDINDGRFLGAPKVFATTATLQYDLWKNVLSRVEFRWDHAAAGGNAYGGETAAESPTRHNSYILLANVVYKF